jgi:uncharacterized protein
VKFSIYQIEEVAKELAYEEPTASLNDVLVHGGVCDYTFTVPAAVRVEYYRAGQELFFHGHITGNVVGQCARCVEKYDFMLEKDFSIVLVPKRELKTEAELEEEDLDLSFYAGEEIDLSPLVREQLILALPTRPLCREGCRGLCPHCGVNLNMHKCSCTTAAGDPRLAVLHNLKVQH